MKTASYFCSVKLYHNIRLLYTPVGFSAKRGKEMADIETVPNAAILTTEDGRIQAVGSFSEERPTSPPIPSEKRIEIEEIDCRGLVALPGFVDSHTHAVFYGERSEEFAMRAEGRSYQEIAGMGGGIRSSVEAVGQATKEEIAEYSRPFTRRALALGTTLMEIKSGYGLSLEAERKLLEAADIVSRETPMQIVKTFLGAHAVPRGRTQREYVESIVSEQLPSLYAMAEFCDVFMDEGYFSEDETVRICKRAKELGMKIKLHADELAETHGAETAVTLGAFSADHLLNVSDAGIRALSESEHTVATLLPITALSLRAAYAPARKLIDAGCAVALATDCNPGSSMSENMQFAVSLGVIAMQMSPAEALTAATLNGAAALDRARTHGTIEGGKMADFVLYDIPRLEYMPYHIAVSDIVAVVRGGSVVSGAL